MTDILTLAQVGGREFGHMDGWGWFAPVIAMVFMAALIGLMVWLILSVVRKPPATKSGQARALLDERYAKGEIEREDYLARKTDLDE